MQNDQHEPTRTSGLTHQPRNPKRQRPRKSRGRFWLFSLLAIAALILFAPTIVLKTGVRNKLIPWAVPQFPGQVTIGSASGNWLGPVHLNDVQVFDAEGQVVASIPGIRTTKKLYTWVSDQRNLGEIHIDSPELQLALSENTSNLEQLFESFASSAEDEPSSSTSIHDLPVTTLNVTNGRIYVRDLVGGQDCTIENLNVQVTTPDVAPAPIVAKLSADAQQGGHRGNLAAGFNWIAPNEITATNLGDGEVTLISQEFPLPVLQPVLRRAESDLSLTGRLTSNLTSRWKRTQIGPSIEAQGELSVAEPRVRMPSVLDTDQLALNHLTAKVDVVSAENQVQIRSVTLNSDVAAVELLGQAELADVMSMNDVVAKLLDSQSAHQFHVRGQVDVAALAAQIPKTLQLREGTQVDHGHINLDIDSRMELGSRVIRGSLQTDRIEGQTAGKSISWDAPVSISTTAISNANGVEVKQLKVASDFLTVDANGTLQQGQLKAQGDLRRLANQIHQFSDLGQLQVTGGIAANGGWQRTANDQIRLQIKTALSDFALQSETIPPVAEKSLTLDIYADGQVTPKGIQRIDAGQLSLISGEDQLVAQLTQPVANPSAESTLPINCQLKGHTETWLARLAPWGVNLQGWDVRAGINATAAGTVHASKIDLNPCNLNLTNVSAQSPGWLIREPQIQVQCAAQWQAEGNRVAIPTVTVVANAIQARGVNLVAAMTETSVDASGQLAFAGDLARLYAWQYAAQPPTQSPQGTFEGQLSVSTTNNQIAFDGTTNVKQFAWLQRTAPAPAAGMIGVGSDWAPVWEEPEVKLAAKGSYDTTNDTLRFEQATATSSLVTLGAQGGLEHVSTSPNSNLQGEVRYDLAAIAARFRDQLGPDIQIAGKRTAPFQLSGPLSSAKIELANQPGAQPTIQQLSATTPVAPVVPFDLAGQAKLGWDLIEAYGVKLGPQEITTRLQQGNVLFSPLATTVAEGKITIQPRLELNSNPMALVVNEGLVADGINITPEMCSSWFQYITPVLAGAATAEGKMSIYMQGARIPLTDPTAGELAGRIEIHGAKVQPGPLAQQLLGTVTQIAGVVQRNAPSMKFLNEGTNWLELQQQQVEFQMADGKVFHRNMEFTSGNVIVRTKGWVSADQTVGMLAEIPIQDEWVEGERFLSALKGETIKVPISGTLSKPQLDRRAVSELSRQLIGTTAEKLIQDELQNGLQKGLQKLLGQ